MVCTAAVLLLGACSGKSRATDPVRAAECKKLLLVSNDVSDPNARSCRDEGYDLVWNALGIYSEQRDYVGWARGDTPTCEDILGRPNPLFGGTYGKSDVASCNAAASGKDIDKQTGEFGTAISNAAAQCGLEANVGDKGESISFNTKGNDDIGGDELSDVVCVLQRLEVPDRVVQRLDNTRALDGSVEDEWGAYKAFWTYHPDSGLSMTVYVA